MYMYYNTATFPMSGVNIIVPNIHSIHSLVMDVYSVSFCADHIAEPEGIYLNK